MRKYPAVQRGMKQFGTSPMNMIFVWQVSLNGRVTTDKTCKLTKIFELFNYHQNIFSCVGHMYESIGKLFRKSTIMCFNIYNDYLPCNKVCSLSTRYNCVLLQSLMVAVSLHPHTMATHWALHKRRTPVLPCCSQP